MVRRGLSSRRLVIIMFVLIFRVCDKSVSEPGYVAYAFFPTINKLRPWENHPFSVNSTAAFHSSKVVLASNSPIEQNSRSSSNIAASSDVEKLATTQVKYNHVLTSNNHGATSVLLIVKKNAGLTAALKENHNLPTFVDSPYPQHPTHEILECDHVLLIGGGISITGLLAYGLAHPNVKVAWGVKASNEALAREVQEPLGRVAKNNCRYRREIGC